MCHYIYLTRMLPINHNAHVAPCPKLHAPKVCWQTAYHGTPQQLLSIGLVPMKQSGREITGLETVICGVMGMAAARLAAKLDIIRLGRCRQSSYRGFGRRVLVMAPRAWMQTSTLIEQRWAVLPKVSWERRSALGRCWLCSLSSRTGWARSCLCNWKQPPCEGCGRQTLQVFSFFRKEAASKTIYAW